MQIFEKTLKLVLNMDSIKECMSIFLTFNLVFTLWEIIFLEWERCNMLDESGEIPTLPPKSIRKFVFGCLTNM